VPYREHVIVKTELAGRQIEIIVPRYLPATTILKCVEIDDALFAIGQSAEIYRDEPLGVMLLAKERDRDIYETVVWHEVFPRALKVLGFTR
jgi:hypothetical protein